MSNLQSLEQRMDKIDYQVISDDKDRQIADLEAKLAEKDKEIETIKDTHIYRFYLHEDKVQDVYMTDVMLKVFNQDKISFCIEQLEKVKDSFFDIANGWWLCFRDGTQYMTHNELEGCVREIFDNQIEELKRGMR